MQAEAAAALDTAITVQRITSGSDGYGSSPDTWSTVNTVQGMLSLPTGTYMQDQADRLTSVKTWVVSVPVGTDIRLKDHLVVGTDTLLVETVNAPESYAVLTHILCSEAL